VNERTASCSCGALRATARGEPVRVSLCHCLDCKRTTGSAFGYNATFVRGQVDTEGPSSRFRRSSDEGYWVAHSFCPSCGATLFYEIERRPGMISIPAGAFADPEFPEPTVSVYPERAHSWISFATDRPIAEE